MTNAELDKYLASIIERLKGDATHEDAICIKSAAQLRLLSEQIRTLNEQTELLRRIADALEKRD